MATNSDGEERSDNDDDSHHYGEEYIDLNLDEVLNDIDDKGAKGGSRCTPSFNRELEL